MDTRIGDIPFYSWQPKLGPALSGWYDAYADDHAAFEEAVNALRAIMRLTPQDEREIVDMSYTTAGARLPSERPPEFLARLLSQWRALKSKQDAIAKTALAKARVVVLGADRVFMVDK